MNFDQAVAAIEKQSGEYAQPVRRVDAMPISARRSTCSETKPRAERLIVNLVLGGHAAYRTQLFCYLKACGRDELNTMNLWAGSDAATHGLAKQDYSLPLGFGATEQARALQ